MKCETKTSQQRARAAEHTVHVEWWRLIRTHTRLYSYFYQDTHGHNVFLARYSNLNHHNYMHYPNPYPNTKMNLILILTLKPSLKPLTTLWRLATQNVVIFPKCPHSPGIKHTKNTPHNVYLYKYTHSVSLHHMSGDCKNNGWFIRMTGHKYKSERGISKSALHWKEAAITVMNTVEDVTQSTH